MFETKYEKESKKESCSSCTTKTNIGMNTDEPLFMSINCDAHKLAPDASFDDIGEVF